MADKPLSWTVQEQETVKKLAREIGASEKEMYDLGKNIVSTLKEKIKLLKITTSLERVISDTISEYSEKHSEMLSIDAKLKSNKEKIAKLEKSIQSEKIKNNLTSMFIARRNVAVLEDENVGLQRNLNTQQKQLTVLQQQLKTYTMINELFNMSQVAIKKVYGIFNEQDAAINRLRIKFALYRGEFGSLENVVKSVTHDLMSQGVTFDEAASAAIAIGENFLSMAAVSTDLVKNVAAISAQFNITSKASADFLRTLAQISGKSSKDAAEGVFGIAVSMSKAAGVPLDNVMSDIAKASTTTRTMFKNSTVELIKASVEARRLGTTIDNMAKSSRFMLDFEESVNAEMEASVLTGRNLNLNRARQLSWAKDTVGANKEILKQVKSLGDFNSFNTFQQESIAKATGKTVDELQSMLQREKEIELLRKTGNKDAISLANQYEKQLNASEKKLKMDAKSVQQRIKEESTLMQITNITNRLKSILLTELAPAIDWMEKSLDGVGRILNKIVTFLREHKTAAKWTAGIVSGVIALTALVGVSHTLLNVWKKIFFFTKGGMGSLLSPSKTLNSGNLLTRGLSSISKSLKMITRDIFGIFVEITRGIGNMLGSFLKAIGSPKALMGAATLLVLSGAVWIFGKSMQLFEKIDWNKASMGLAMFIVSLIGLTIVGAIMGALSEVLIPGAIVIAAFGAAAWVFAKALSASVPFVEAYGEVITKVFNGIGSIITKVGDVFVKLIKATTQSFKELSTIGDKLYTTAGGIAAVSAALASFGGGSALAGIGAGIGKLFGGDVISKLQKITDLSDKLKVAADSVNTIRSSVLGETVITQESPKTSLGTENRKEKSSLQENCIEIVSGIQEMIKKQSELISLLKAGAISVNMDGRKMSNQLAYVSREGG